MSINTNFSKNTNNIFNVKSQHILQKIFDNLNPVKLLKIIKYNNNLHNLLKKDINDYKKSANIIIEVIPFQRYQIQFDGKININCDENYRHIYFNDRPEEIKRNYFTKDEHVKKIKIVFDYRLQSLNGIFSSWKDIEVVNFIKFNRTNINTLNSLFDDSFIEEINFFDFPESGVTEMKGLFSGCKY